MMKNQPKFKTWNEKKWLPTQYVNIETGELITKLVKQESIWETIETTENQTVLNNILYIQVTKIIKKIATQLKLNL